jgi:hypothetical protein
LTGQVESVLSEIASQSGYEIVTQPDLPAEALARAKVVVALPPAAGLAEAAASAPGVQFLAAGIPGLEPANNLSILETGGGDVLAGMAAGYLAAVITPDWRIGMLNAADAPQAAAVRQAFADGVLFFCGLCRPAYPPYVAYPVITDVSSASAEGEAIAALDALAAQGVDTVYLPAPFSTEAVAGHAAQIGLQVIGSGPPPGAARSLWVASISSDLPAAVREAWPDLSTGKGGLRLETPLVLTERNEGLFSEGRQALVDRFLQDLQSGFITPSE